MAAMAIRSALNQDFRDLEVVVSDNSGADLAEKLKETVDEMADRRLRYVRPPTELAMGEHWDFALNEARGEYVGYLTDRMAFKRNALTLLNAEIAAHHAEVISYSSSGILEVAPRGDKRAYQATDNFVRAAKRHPPADQVVGDIGRQQQA